MKLKKSAWLLLCLTLVLSLFLAACSGGDDSTAPADSTDTETEAPADDTEKEEEPADTNEPQYGGDLIVGSIGSPTLFNSLYSSDNSSGEIEGFLFNGMVGGDTEFNPVNDLASDVQMSEDGLTWTIKLREDVKWHDGEQFTADDVVFTYNIPLHADYDGPRKSAFEGISSITKLGEFEIEIVLSKVDATFGSTGLSYGILPEHILGSVPVAELGEHEFNTKSPIGTGPFKFAEWKDGEYVKVVANEDYYEGRPYLDSITYKIVPDQNALLAQLQAGDVHYINVPGTDLETVKEFPGIQIQSGLALSYTYFGVNQLQDRFKDVRVRQAFTHALDREGIVEAVMNGDGEVAHVPESPLSWAYSDDVTKFEYDPEKAKALLAEAGWTDTDGDGWLDKDGEKLSFTVKTNQGNKIREDIAVVLQQQFKEIGVEAIPQIVEWSAFIEQVTAPNWDYDAMILGWALSTFPDLYDIFHSSQMEQGLNFTHWDNAEASKLMEDARQILDRDEYKKAYGEIYKIVSEEQPYTFLYYPNAHYAMPENLMGKEFHARSAFYDINKWWFKAE